ncbi:hypothetical protein IMCC1989_2695 [gamma proteobacterium IMCC1989]|nr:hypothetical protein IMCC1989_2695 [gamma proteobacterium IMCC1989]
MTSDELASGRIGLTVVRAFINTKTACAKGIHAIAISVMAIMVA